MTEKVTTMVLKVDLDCHCCYKKVKKLLCKFPEVRNQVYDEKENKVIVSVVCCSPEKIRDKLCYKGGKVIKSIAIREPPQKPTIAAPEKPEQPEKPKGVAPEKPKEPEKPKVVAPEKPKELEKPKVFAPEKPKEPEKPKAGVPAGKPPKEPEKPKVVVMEKPKEPEKPKSNGKVVDAPPVVMQPKEMPKPFPAGPPPPEPVKMMEAFPAQGLPHIYPGMPYGGAYYDSYNGGGGPYYNNYHGFGVPPPPQPSYEGYYYVPGHHGYGQEDGGHYRRYESYLTDENPAACSIM